MDDRDQKVREYAYKIWEDEGRPDGNHEDHWRRAEQQHDVSEQEATEETDENWRVEAGLPDGDRAPGIMPIVIPPD